MGMFLRRITEKPPRIHEISLHDEWIGVWCAVNGYRIIGPIFYNTINGKGYKTREGQFEGLPRPHTTGRPTPLPMLFMHGGGT